MADAQTSSTDNTGLGINLDQLVKQAQGGPSGGEFLQLLKRDQDETARYEKSAQPLRDEMVKSIKADRDESAALYKKIEPFKPEAQPQYKDYKTDPVSAFGSFAMIFAQIAAGLTHQPMVNALTAGAAAMNAVHDNDYENYKIYYDAWKDNTSIALERHKSMMEDWQALRERNKDNMAGYEQEMAIFGAQHGDQVALMQREAGLIGQYDQVMQGRQNAALNMLQLVPEMEKRHIQYTGLLNDEDWKSGDSVKKAAAAVRWGIIPNPLGSRAGAVLNQEKYGIIQRMLAEWSQAHNGQTPPADVELNISNNVLHGYIPPGEATKLKERVNLIDNSLDTIDEVLATLNKYSLAAGAAGRARRLGETIEDILGGNETDLVQMRRNIELLQTTGSRILTDSSGRPLAGEAARINNVIGGLQMGDTTANTIRSLQEARDKYLQTREEDLDILGGNFQPGGAPPGGTKPPGVGGATPPGTGEWSPPTGPWDSDPIGH